MVVGDAKTLQTDEHWCAFIDWCKAHGTYQKAQLDHRNIAPMYKTAADSWRQMKDSNEKRYNALTDGSSET